MSDYQVVQVCSLVALGDPGAREFHSGEGDWPYRGVVVQVRGELRAYANVCPHKRHPLNIDDDDFLMLVFVGLPTLLAAWYFDLEEVAVSRVEGPQHGALFEPETGLCVHGPCAGRTLSGLECWVENGKVLVRAPVSA